MYRASEKFYFTYNSVLISYASFITTIPYHWVCQL